MVSVRPSNFGCTWEIVKHSRVIHEDVRLHLFLADSLIHLSSGSGIAEGDRGALSILQLLTKTKAIRQL